MLITGRSRQFPAVSWHRTSSQPTSQTARTGSRQTQLAKQYLSAPAVGELYTLTRSTRDFTDVHCLKSKPQLLSTSHHQEANKEEFRNGV